jgi:hypothetical protein
MYFDAVLDGLMYPLFNGTRDETRQWLRDNPEIASAPEVMVCTGENLAMITVPDYLAE